MASSPVVPQSAMSPAPTSTGPLAPVMVGCASGSEPSASLGASSTVAFSEAESLWYEPSEGWLRSKP